MQLPTLWQDLRYSLRVLHKNLAFAGTVALTFGLGVGATTAIFTVVSGVLLRPLPFPQAGRLVSIREDYGRGPNVFVGSPELVEWQKQSRTMNVGGYFDCSVNLVGPSQTEHLEGGSISQSMLPVLGVQPLLGRNFVPDEDRLGGPPAVLLSHALWKQRFGGDRSIVGRSLALDDRSYTVVGVMPEGFQIPGEFRTPQELWIPFQLEESRAHLRVAWAVGRLREGASIGTAQAEVETIFQTLRRGRKVTGHVVLTPWQRQITGQVRNTLVIFLAAVGFVLLIACVNAANLLLARATGREKEMAVRRALGAGTARIVQQLLAESILMALAGGLMGLLLAFWAKNLLLAFLATSLPTLPPIPLDLRVLAFNLGLAVVCGIAFGIAPALQATRIPVNECLKEGGRGSGAGRGHGRLTNLLVVSEVALAMALLIGAGLLFHSFLRLRGMDSHTPSDRILTLFLRLKGAHYSAPQQRTAYYQEALERTRNIPGVVFTAATTDGAATIPIEGRGETEASALWSVTTPDYFRVMEIPLLRGRPFATSDAATAPEVAIVNRSFAARYFPNEECLGKRLGSLFQKGGWMTIIGVAEDSSEGKSGPQPVFYTHYLQEGKVGAGEPAMTLLVRTAGDAASIVPPARAEISAIDRTQTPVSIETLEQSQAKSIAPRRVNMLLLVSFAMLALMLGSVGVYGVMSHAVSRRTHEIGVRMALGAGRRNITELIVGRGLLLVILGEAVGIAAALVLNRVIASMLFHVTTTDPLTYGGVAVMWVAVGLVACYLPARRAVRVDPTVALRCQ